MALVVGLKREIMSARESEIDTIKNGDILKKKIEANKKKTEKTKAPKISPKNFLKLDE